MEGNYSISLGGREGQKSLRLVAYLHAETNESH